MKKLCKTIVTLALCVLSAWTIAQETWEWTPYASGTSKNLYGVAYGNGLFVAAGDEGTFLTSTDGITWAPHSSTAISYVLGITYGNGLFVAVGIKGSSGVILTSLDAVTWTTSYSSAKYAISITYGNGLFVAVGSGGSVLTSPDGATWTARTSATTNALYGVTYDNNQFVAVGYTGTVVASTNGINWNRYSSGTTSENLESIAYGNGTFTVVGQNGIVLTSSNGTTWNRRPSGTTEYLNGITYGNGLFVAVGNGGSVLTSPDGVTWYRYTSVTTNSLTCITSGNGQFVAAGASGTILRGVSPQVAVELTSSANPAVYGQTIMLTATVMGNIDTPSGTVGFWHDGNSISGCATVALSNNQAVCQATGDVVGTTTLSAIYSGDSTYPSSAGSFEQTVDKANSGTQITLISPNPSKPGQAAAVTVKVTPVAPGAGTPTGEVMVSDGVGQCTASLSNGAGACTLSPAAVKSGSYTVSAHYNGDSHFMTGDAPGVTRTVKLRTN